MDYRTKDQLDRMNQQVRELTSIYRVAVGQSGISENEFWIWYTLINMEGAYSQQDLCSIWSLSKQTVNTIIAHMTQKGCITLESMPGTRNRKRICLTQEGYAHGKNIVLPIFAAEQRAFEKLREEERDIFEKVLGQYVHGLKDALNEMGNG